MISLRGGTADTLLLEGSAERHGSSNLSVSTEQTKG